MVTVVRIFINFERYADRVDVESKIENELRYHQLGILNLRCLLDIQVEIWSSQ